MKVPPLRICQNYVVIILSVGILFSITNPLSAQQNPEGLAIPGTARIADKFTPLIPSSIHLNGGMLGTRLDASEKKRLLNVDENELLDAFEQREKEHQDWQGEHVGKFLHAASLEWNYTKDAALKLKIDRVAHRLMKTQMPDGYLGTYIPAKRWGSWDVWVHKYALLGLLTYFQYTHDKSALATCRRVGDLLCNTFGTRKRDINRAGTHMGMAADSVLEPMMLLYRATKERRYLNFASYIVSNYDSPDGPAILTSLEKHRSVAKVANGKAYEMTSNFNGILELYRATGDPRLLSDMRIAWKDIVDNRLYLTGGASSGEHFVADYHLPNGENGAICETCVTVTWEQMNLQMLRLTGESQFADQAERSIYNHLLGAQKPSGDEWVYYTPLEGHKAYGHETNCCLSSGPRGVALIPEFAVMASSDGGAVVNLYNSGYASLNLPNANVKLKIVSRYPWSGAVSISLVTDKKSASFPLRLRIPGWCSTFSYRLNGAATVNNSKRYLVLSRKWSSGDIIKLNFKMEPKLILGDHENLGKAAVKLGPLVYAVDLAMNPLVKRPAQIELISSKLNELKFKSIRSNLKDMPDILTIQGRVAGSNTAFPIKLTPFSEAGQNGTSRYTVWMALPGKGTAVIGPVSLLEGDAIDVSRFGNKTESYTDEDISTYFVSYDGKYQKEDWYAVLHRKPVKIRRVIFAHGKTFHDGGWFDTSTGKPKIQAQIKENGEWVELGVLEKYPATTATDSTGLQDGQKFEIVFPPVIIYSLRVIGKPATGDNPKQSFSSISELQAFD